MHIMSPFILSQFNIRKNINLICLRAALNEKKCDILMEMLPKLDGFRVIIKDIESCAGVGFDVRHMGDSDSLDHMVERACVRLEQPASKAKFMATLAKHKGELASPSNLQQLLGG